MARLIALGSMVALTGFAFPQTTTTFGVDARTRPSAEKIFARPVEHTARFSATATVLDFGTLAPGASSQSYTRANGVSLELFDGSAPLAWHDPKPRKASATSVEPGVGGAQAFAGRTIDGALRIDQTTPSVWPPNGPSFGEGSQPVAPLPVHGALEMRFDDPVSRVGFHARSLDAHGATLVLSAFAGPHAVASWTFSGSPSFQVFGLESSAAFDMLRIDLVNPGTGSLSLDNLSFEADFEDGDGDTVPDFIDSCSGVFNPLQEDGDGDGIGDVCDPYPSDPDNDRDGDGIPAPLDNCAAFYNPGQHDADGDGIGDACDPLPLAIDSDGDGIEDPLDNCVDTFNPDQRDCDGDGIGDVCDASLLSPASVSLTLARGQNADVNEKICLPPVAPIVDLVLAVDNTGSMGGEIANVKRGLVEAINKIEAFLPADLRFALVTFRDYPSAYNSCGYSGTYGGAGDYAFRVDGSIDDETPKILTGVNAMLATGGHDGPESYTRVLWEIGQPDSGIKFRTGSARYVVLMGDNIPHDCDIGGGLPCSLPNTTGVDPGRDEIIGTADDLDFYADSLPALTSQFIRLVTIYSNTSSEFCAWQQWSEMTNGNSFAIPSSGTIPPGLSIARTIFKLAGSGEYNALTPVVRAGSQLQIAFTPPVIQGPGSFNSAGGEVPFKMNVAVPSSLPAGVTTASAIVDVYADGALIGTQTVSVTVQ